MFGIGIGIGMFSNTAALSGGGGGGASLYSQDFESTSAGSLPAGWANAVGTWQVTTSNVSTGTKGITSTSQGALDAVVYTGVSMTDGTITFDFKTIMAASLGASSAITAIFRCDSGFANGYLINWQSTGDNLELYKRVSGSYSLIDRQTSAVSPPAYTVGDVIRTEVTLSGTSISIRLWNVTTGGSRPSSALHTWTDATFSSGYAGLLNDISGLGSTTPTADNFTLA